MLDVLAAGAINADILVVEADKIAGPGDVVYLSRPIDCHIGGFPIDVAIDLFKLGADPDTLGVVAALGDGLFGRFVRETINGYGLRAFTQEIKHVDTGKNIVFELKGEDRRFHIDPGANWFLDKNFVIDQIKTLSPTYFCVRPGYSGIDLYMEEILFTAKKQGAFVFLDIMKPHPLRSRHFILPSLAYADLVHCNEIEAMVNTGKNSPEEAVQELLDRKTKAVLLTRGERGASLIGSNFAIHQQGFKVKAVDVTGCGDAFCAGILYKLMEYKQNRDIRDLPAEKINIMLSFAQAVGASAATAAGCVEGVSRLFVDELMGTVKNSKN